MIKKMKKKDTNCRITGKPFNCKTCIVPSWHPEDGKCGGMLGDDFTDRVQEDIAKLGKIRIEKALGVNGNELAT